MNPILRVFVVIIICICSVFIILFIIGIAEGIRDTVTGNVDASETRRSLSESVSKDVPSTAENVATQNSSTKSGRREGIEITSDELNWYDTLQDAMDDTGLVENDYYFESYNKDLRYLLTETRSSDGRDYLIYASPAHEGDGMSIDYTGLYYKDGKYSQPYRIGYNYIDYSHSHDDLYDCDDNISQELTMEYTLGPQIIAENGNQVFYGSWGDQKEIESMTIDGHKPDKLIQYVINGKKHYFWYYTQTDLATKLREIDYSNYTLQQVTDLIGIKYELDTSVENAKDKY